jgi:hypothetical protein
MATVEYKDSVMLTKPDLSDSDSLLANITAFGCVFLSEHSLSIVFTINGKEPLTVLVIPLASVVKITGMKEDKPEPPKQSHLQKLPNATPQSINGGHRKYGKEMI